jgi:prenyltransferase beta subunit
MTYTAIAILKMCGDDLSRLKKSAIIKAMSTLQREDGSFSPVAGGSENDMRFIYCAGNTLFYFLFRCRNKEQLLSATCSKIGQVLTKTKQ